MAELKTQKTKASVSQFLNAIKDDQVRKDCKTVSGLMQKATRAKPAMWGPSIIGFGTVHLKYASGRELDWLITGFAPRKGNITLYVLGPYAECEPLLAKLGRHTRGGSCLHIKRLSDVHMPTLTKLIAAGVRHARKQDTRA